MQNLSLIYCSLFWISKKGVVVVIENASHDFSRRCGKVRQEQTGTSYKINEINECNYQFIVQ